ncbi:unnamed protein product [Porites evermanni]|uniref:Galactosylgalactosylxylosylprotein 3-beta-glucuronosyltransferase n=1 Tax=Porites evermanni TaxID=104178 RepID=A0ABN8M0L4_9CNID|nr:unnamed protein product [Porites evermanni]
MFRGGAIKYVIFLSVLLGIVILTKVLQNVIEKANIKTLYFSQYNGRLVRKLPGITTLPVPSQLENNNSKDQFLSCSETAIYEQQLLLEKLEAKVRELQEKLAMQNSGWDPKLPTIFAITPTYRRFLQKAELTRTAQTLKHIKNLHWIVVEDSHEKTNLVKRLLNHFGIRYTHLNVRTPVEMRIGRNKPWWTKSRGTEQRNVGLKWIRDNIKANETKGVVYFADDDNTYDIRLFDEMRTINTVGVWPVAFTGAARWAGPICEDGHVVGFHTNWKPFRTFPVDMSAFAVSLKKLLVERPEARFDPDIKPGFLETSFLEQITTMEQLEPKASNCMKVYVWHTRTETPIININGEKQLIKRGKPSNPDVET